MTPPSSNEANQDQASNAPWLLAALLAIAATYAAPLFHTYLFADEMNYFRADPASVFAHARIWAESTGRPFAGLVMGIYDDALLMGEAGLRALRAGTLVISLTTAAAAFAVLRQLALPAHHAALLTVFLWSQPAFAVHHAYLGLTPYWFGLLAALVSIAVFLARAGKRMTLTEIAFHAALYLGALGTFQGTAFFVLPFLAYHVVTARGHAVMRRTMTLFVILGVTVWAYAFGFRLATSVGFGTYGNAQALVKADALTFFFGSGYCAVFEFWNYPLPVDLSETAVKGWLLTIVPALSALTLFAAIVVDLRHRPGMAGAWALAMICFAACFLPIAADGGGDRQHLAIAASGGWVLLMYRSLCVLLRGSRPRLFGAAVLGVTVLCIGAGAGLHRGIVRPYSAHFDLAVSNFAAVEAAERVTVLVPDPAMGACHLEPCTAFFGRRIPGEWHVTRPGFYQFAARAAGHPDEFDIAFVTLRTAIAPAARALTIDWGKLSLTELGAR